MYQGIEIVILPVLSYQLYYQYYRDYLQSSIVQETAPQTTLTAVILRLYRAVPCKAKTSKQ